MRKTSWVLKETLYCDGKTCHRGGEAIEEITQCTICGKEFCSTCICNGAYCYPCKVLILDFIKGQHANERAYDRNARVALVREIIRIQKGLIGESKVESREASSKDNEKTSGCGACNPSGAKHDEKS